MRDFRRTSFEPMLRDFRFSRKSTAKLRGKLAGPNLVTVQTGNGAGGAALEIFEGEKRLNIRYFRKRSGPKNLFVVLQYLS